MSIHKRIKELRLKRKMSQQDVGEAIGVSWQTVQQWENGKTAPNRTARLEKVANLFNVSLSYLLTGEESLSENNEPDLSFIPMMDLKLSAGIGNLVFEFDGSRKIAFRTEYLQKRGIKPENAFGFPVDGESMVDAGIPNGSMVAVNLAAKEPSNKKYYAMWIDGEYLVKEIVKRSDGFYAISHNVKNKDLYPDRLIDSENSGIIGQVFYCGFEL